MSGLHDPPLGESDTRSKLIDPAIHARGWTEEHIRREETAGAIEIINGKPRRRSKGRVDYTLRVKVSGGDQPVALGVIEAKAENLPPGHGLEQAKSYARCKRLNVPFAFSSNGHMFVEYDNFTKLTSPPRPMAEFPTCDELRARYEARMGFGLAEEVAKPLVTPYSGGEAKRRYYQDAAIRAVFEKVAKAEKDGEPKRALLSLATGAGKTFIAVQLLRRIAADEAAPFKKQATAKQQEANRWKEALAGLKKVKGKKRDKAKIEKADQRIKELTKEARELAARAQDIEDAVYDLKAVNPNKQAEEDTHTPAELLDTIEAKGREVAEALAVLRSL